MLRECVADGATGDESNARLTGLAERFEESVFQTAKSNKVSLLFDGYLEHMSCHIHLKFILSKDTNIILNPLAV